MNKFLHSGVNLLIQYIIVQDQDGTNNNRVFVVYIGDSALYLNAIYAEGGAIFLMSGAKLNVAHHWRLRLLYQNEKTTKISNLNQISAYDFISRHAVAVMHNG